MNFFKKIRKAIKSSFLYEVLKNYFPKVNKSFSETYGEDLFVNYFFKDLKKGFYVDIGCNLPKSGSLTYMLYKKGWSGIKVDISKRSIELNKIYRKRDINLNLSVGKDEKVVDSFIFYDNCSMNTVNKEFRKYTEKSVKKKPTVNKITQKKLDSILKNNNISKINYLNIDVEGNESEVLNGFKISKFKPELVSIEIHDKKCPPLENKVYKYFVKNNYELISIYGWTYFFTINEKNNIHFDI
ncbi:MAG: hypothetical protein CL572_03790 [Alphaproteobacteria bacterium]|nr:hypothetical protein [Alphaproteobacteria bacterium]|tara:strand:- start:58 stop:780 length:723 start_codon:yes stop_codon:yes gene_type:complete